MNQSTAEPHPPNDLEPPETYVFPASPEQRRLYFLEQLEPGTARFNVTWTADVEGRLDSGLLGRAVELLVARHEALRTIFRLSGAGEPVQRVLPTAAVPVDVHRGTGAARAEVEHAERPFDLEHGPLMRVLWLPEAGRLLLTVHHLVVDGWSMQVLVRELAELYGTLVERPETARDPLPEPELQYGDYADWCADQEGSAKAVERRKKDLEYWHRRLEGADAEIELPKLERPADDLRSTEVAAVTFELSTDRADALKALGRRSGATLFTTLLAAYAVTLSRLGGRRDLTLGTVTAGRDREELQGVVGFFVRTVALRVSIDPNQTFDRLLVKLRQEVAEDFLHQETRFEEVVEALAPRRSTSAGGPLAQNPLFETLLALQEELPRQELPGDSTWSWSIRRAAAAQFDWVAQFQPRADGTLLGSLEYRTGAFAATDMERLVQRLQALLHALVDDRFRTTPVGRLPILPEGERRWLLEWAEPRDTDPGPAPFPGRLAELVEAHPTRTALEGSDIDGREIHWTYGQVADRAARLSERLIAESLHPDTIVGLFLPRCPEAAVAMLGIQGAGAAFLPLDPAYPEDRLRYMLDDAGAKWIVTHSQVAQDLPTGQYRTLLLDELWSDLGSRRAPVPNGLEPDHLAYVIYTSGSTGKPKGVAVSHRGLRRFASSFAELYDLDETSRVLQFSSLSFDACVAEVYSTLWAGGTLCFGHPDELMPGPELVDLLRRRRVSHALLVPSALAALDEPELPELRTVVVAGEACPGELARRWAPGRRLVNAYGPTEITVCATGEVIDLNTFDPRRSPPIGHATAQHRLYVVDDQGELCPVGTPGQLMIGGPSLARGYLGRPSLTAERFVPDPFSSRPGARMYASGDLVRRLADGRLDFLGRIDHQVKVRGFRIELGEIESALSAHPEVREAIVLARDDMGPAQTSAAKTLVAYVVPRQTDRCPEVDELRAFLATDLPDHMVPSAFMSLDELPHLPNGKVNRRDLPRPEGGQSRISTEPPRTPMEETVAEVWTEVLGLEGIGRKDSFFAVGGHSLLATQVMARLSERLGQTLPVRRLFECPTVAKLADSLTANDPAAGLSAIPKLDLDDQGSPLSFAQDRLWFLDRLDPDSPVYNVPVVVDLEGPLSLKHLSAALDALVARHESLRTSFVAVDEAPVQRIHSAESNLPLPLAVEEVSADRELLDQRTTAELSRPFRLDQAPLIRARLLRSGPERRRLVLTLHHIISDGVSVEILLSELWQAYGAFYRGETPRWSEPTVRPRDVAVWRRQRLADGSPRLAQELNHWRHALDGAPTTLDLPTDRPRPSSQTFAGAAVHVALDRDRIQTLAEECDATPFMILLAAWGAFLSRITGAEQVLIGSPVAGRDRRELESLVGFLVNTLVLRVDLRPDEDGRQPSFRRLVQRAKAVALDAYAHPELPFEKLVEALEPKRDLARSPLFQTLLAFHTRTADPEPVEGLKMTPKPVPPFVAKFELSLVLDDSCTGFLEYNTDLFDRGVIEHWGRSLRCFIDAALTDPGADMRRLPLLTGELRRQVMDAFNRNEPLRRKDTALHHLFFEQAERTPDAAGLTTADRTLTYAELRRVVEFGARRLAEAEVGPEKLVAVFPERRAEMPAALLAIMAAGGAYVPLDAKAPADRTAFLLADADVCAVLTHRSLRDRLPAEAISELPVIEIDDWVDLALAEPAFDAAELPDADPERLAYLIYTSGSTGRPKAVAIEHRSAVGLVEWAQRLYSPEELAGTLACTSITFDLSVYEMFLPLAMGGRVILADDALHLAEHPAADQVTLINTVPSAVAELIRMDAVPPSVRTINLAGEPLPRALADAVYALPQVETLYNLYGPSEDTTYTTWVLVPEREDREPSIGRPIDGTRIHLLDPAKEPVPVGVPGELYVGGDGLAREYLGRPELTAERFITDPFAGSDRAESGRAECLYRTGDLARYRPDGQIDFLGRLDFQVKIRGFRIELGEIEAALAKVAGLRESVVMAVDGLADDGPVREKRLAAWIVPMDPQLDLEGDHGLEAELRQKLAEDLPEYMVPSVFVRLDALPRTPNGKVDRKRLPAPDWKTLGQNVGQNVGSRTESDRPLSATERQVAETFAEVLGLDRLPGPDKGFFALGGHSLRAVRVVSRLNAALGTDLPLRVLFEAPTVAELAARLDAEGHATDAAPELIQPTDEAPLSFAQERLWVLDQMRPGSAVYNVPWVLELRGPLDVDALGRALESLVERHRVLRTCFASGPSLRIVESQELELDLEPRPAADLEAARGLVDEEIRRPFALDRPLIRSLLVRVEENARPELHLWALTLHHAVVDGWSWEVMLKELREVYGAQSEGREADLPELPVQYSDFAAWQRQRLSEIDSETGRSRLETQLENTHKRLQGVGTFLEMPTDRPRPKVTDDRGLGISRDLPSELLRRLETTPTDGAETSLFMRLLTVFGVLVSRYTERDDFLIGTPVANRRRPEVENLVGFFADTLVLRLDFRADGPRPTFEQALNRVRADVLDAFADQEVPFERLVEELEPKRDLSRDPLVQVAFSYEHESRRFKLDQGLEVVSHPPETGTSKFDVSLHVLDGDQPRVVVHYRTALFDDSTAERLLDGFVQLLHAVADAPTASIGELTLLDDRAMAELRELSTAPSPHLDAEGIPRDVVSHFVHQASLRPDATALAWRPDEPLTDHPLTHGSLTYGDLDRHSSLLARRLRSMGVHPEVPVGVAMERSPQQVVALLGILKAGGHYVPFDADYPRKRLEYQIQDAQVRVMVAQSSAAERMPIPDDVELVLLDELFDDDTLLKDDGLEPLAEIPDPAQAAYVLYTSGSTGRPKGVVVPHEAVVRLVIGPTYLTEAPGPGDSTFLYNAPISFDASTWEIWGALLTGAKLAVSPAGKLSLEQMAEAVQSLGVDTMLLTAGLFQPFVESHTDSLRGVKHLLTGGDVVSPTHCKQLLAAIPGLTVYDVYGPTENTTLTTAEPMKKPEEVETPVSIGRPVGHTSVWVVDRNLRPVPVGVPGELLTGGLGLARGYHRRPELTAQAFVPDPFSDEPGARLYRTGDLVRQRPDGRLAFLGRRDHQVKVRGFRIELGEIETTLETHPTVSQAVCVAHGQGAGDKRLAAYAVCLGSVGAQELRTYLAERLPEHMVPSAVVQLDAIPVTDIGKPDRRALPEPDWGRANARELESVQARTPVESALAEIWSEVLDLDRVPGVREEFFELGGHSLLATQMVSRVRRLFDVDLPLQRVFEDPTVEALALRIEASLGKAADVPQPVAVERPDAGTPLSFAQQRLWFLDRLHPGDTSYHISGGLHVRGSLNVHALERALIALERRHEALRTVYLAGPAQRVLPAPGPDERTLDARDLRDLEPAAQDRRLRELGSDIADRPFDLEKGPVWRYGLARTADDEHLLFLVIHHIACDGWSLGLMLRELDVLYARSAQGMDGKELDRALPALDLQFPDFAAWQRSVFDQGALAESLEYWRRQLQGVEALNLPTDGRPENADDTSGAEELRLLSSDLTRDLHTLAAQESSTLFMVLLAALQTVLGRWSRQDDVVVGSPLAGRDHLATENIVGCFLETLALRTDLSSEPTFRELLRRVRGTVLGAYGHRSVPFEKLVETLKPERSLARHPFFDVLLNVVNVPPIRPALGDLEARITQAGEGASKLWITLYAEEKHGLLELRLVYRRKLFDRRRMAELNAQLEGLLRQVIADPERSIHDYSLITESSRALLPDPTAALPRPRLPSVAAEIARWAEQHPNLPALRHRGARRTYRELWSDARSVAEGLLDAGLQAGETVAICGRRDFALPAAVVGVLAAGGVLLTLDPKLPTERRRRMIELGRARFLIPTDSRRPEPELLKDLETEILPVPEATVGDGTRELPGLAAPDHGRAAYLFFTSGSTGQPKGVLGRAAGLSHFLAWQRLTFAVGPGDRAAQLTALSFDVVLRDMLMPLTAGATLVLPDDEELGGRRFMDWLRRERITRLHAVPSLARAWLAAQGDGPIEPFTDLRTAFFAGEALTDELVTAWRRAFTGQVVNLYGPTETTLAKCCFPVPAEPVPGVQPVGASLPQSQALVMQGDRLCGVGEPGEIVLRTPYRSLGYVGAEPQDEARFIANPSTEDPEDILYRTGDLGAYRPDGSLAILGRLDHQVKIRGVRVELGEIQALTESHPAVREAVVVARDDGRGGKRLVVYLVADADTSTAAVSSKAVSTTGLRRHLADRLPEALVPSAFVQLDALPLNANGKVDRQALPEPDEPAENAERVVVAARGALERRLVELWQRLLKVEPIGIDDNFFELGGHSLLLVEMQAAIEGWLDRPVPVVELFRRPTIAALARRLDELQTPPTAPSKETAKTQASRSRESNVRRAAARRQIADRGNRRGGLTKTSK